MRHRETGDTRDPGDSGGDRQARPLPPRLDPRAGRAPRSGGAGGAGGAGGSAAAGSVSRGTRRAAVGVRVVAGVMSVLLLGGAGWGWYLGKVAEASVNRTNAIPAAGNEGTGEAPEAVNLLLVGNDSRVSLTPEQLAELNAGEDSGVNTDTMILVHVPADGSTASFVSFPRDSYVAIPGHGQDKLNAAYAYGMQDAPEGADDAARQSAGAQLLVQTISQLTGLQIDHYAEVDLLGFFQLSSVVGGVTVNLCQAVDDSFYSGAVFPAGEQTISGAQALQFVRQRHGLPRGDFDRIVRQQVYIAGVLRNMLSENVLLDLGKQRQLVDAAASSLTIDNGLDLFELAGQMQSVSAGSIEFQTIPFVGDAEDDLGRYILQLADQATLHAFFADLSAEPVPAVPASPEEPETVAPDAVTVSVFNGSGTPGVAAAAAAELEAAGYTVASTGNADSTGYTATEIRYATGDVVLANTLAASIPGASRLETADVEPGTVQLVLGSDFNGVGQALTAPASAAPEGGEAPRTAADTSCIN